MIINQVLVGVQLEANMHRTESFFQISARIAERLQTSGTGQERLMGKCQYCCRYRLVATGGGLDDGHAPQRGSPPLHSSISVKIGISMERVWLQFVAHVRRVSLQFALMKSFSRGLEYR